MTKGRFAARLVFRRGMGAGGDRFMWGLEVMGDRVESCFGRDYGMDWIGGREEAFFVMLVGGGFGTELEAGVFYVV